MEVVIDGTTYVPNGNQTSRVGIAITVRDREDTTKECLAKLREHTPSSVPIVIVDDASKTPYPDAAYRFDTNVGIPAAKNKCLELLMDLGCEYLILMDNDCYPLRDDWLDVFCTVLDEHPHVSAQFQDLKSARQLGDISILYDDGNIEAWSGQRGYCLAYRRDVIESVGGFDPIYSPGLYEHSDLANRIHAAGMTVFRYVSPKDSHLLVESLDQSLKVTRTPLASRAELGKRNARIHNERRESGHNAYVEYRQQHDTIITCLYTGLNDPQRGKRLPADSKALDRFLSSCKGNRVVVLHDELPNPDTGTVSYVKAPNTVNVYFQRWINTLSYLKANPQVRNVLVCDGTDVEILQPGKLFTSIEPGYLTVGCEHQVVGCKWLIDHHPDERLREWMTGNTRQLLNAGVVLGDRATVIEFLSLMVHAWEHIEMDHANGKSAGNGVGDMAVFNHVAYERFGDRLRYGPSVTTMFKSDERNDFSLIKHK